MRATLELQECDLHFERARYADEDASPMRLRDLIQRMSGPAAINDSEALSSEHFALLNEYVLSRNSNDEMA